MQEYRDLDEARRWVVQSLMLMRVGPLSAETLGAALEWSLELASAGVALPSLGFIADAGWIAVRGCSETAASGIAPGPSPLGLDPGLAREYEDYVLGRLYGDMTFQRAADAILRYRDRDRSRALAFLLSQLCERAGLGGVALSPAILKRLREEPVDDVIAEGRESLRDDGLMPELAEHYALMVESVRATGDLLSSEDIFELERGTALAEFGQRLALRQVLHVAAEMSRPLPARKPRAASRAHAVATRLVAEDSYPVGGFSSISTRGTIESLLHSQLIFMERSERPDLFDIKFVRDELLYYSRDENQFLRRHETFLFLLSPDLAAARLKDADVSYQRIVMALALLVTTVRTLIQWLSGVGLRFEFLVLDAPAPALEPEFQLLKMLLGDQIANGTAAVGRIGPDEVPARCALAAQRSLCRCLWVSSMAREVVVDGVLPASLVVDAPAPRLRIEGEAITLEGASGPADAWLQACDALLRAWI